MTVVALVWSWLTPTVLFCVLNLTIGTIFFTSNRKHQDLGDNNGGHPPQLGRVPSFLERVKSINLSRQQHNSAHSPVPAQEQADGDLPPQLGRVPSFFERVKSISLSRQQPDPAYSPVPDQEQADGDLPPPLGRVPSFLERVMSISLSRKLPDTAQYTVPAHEQLAGYEKDSGEQHHVTRSKSETITKTTAAAARMLKKSASEKVSVEKEVSMDELRPATVRYRTTAVEDEAVDEKADDFINRFRQQLKLQRIDSILRYKEMLNRGTGR